MSKIKTERELLIRICQLYFIERKYIGLNADKSDRQTDGQTDLTT